MSDASNAEIHRPVHGRRPVEAVVVAYGGAEALDQCLMALGPAIRVTVVDNSSDAGVAAVAVRHGSTYDDPGANLGFGPAVNRYLGRALAGEPRDVVLVNPDATLTAESVLRLQTFLHEGPWSVAAVAPSLRSPNGASQRVAWPFPRPAVAWLQAFGLGRLARWPGFVVGAVLLIRWEALQSVGLFDERFFLYAEEVDWQRRARSAGWRVAVCPQVSAEHVGGGTSTDPLRREVLFHAAAETYIRKWFGRAGWLSYRTAVLVGCAARLPLLGRRSRSARARAAIYLRGPRRLAEVRGTT